MKYTVLDLYTNVTLAFACEHDLARWWDKTAEPGSYERTFYNLNITGGDTYFGYNDIGRRTQYLRRYRVFDADGRAIDIRTWPKHIWNYPARRYYSVTRDIVCGFKPRAHRLSGPQSRRSSFRSNTTATYSRDELEALQSENMLPELDIDRINFHDKIPIPPFCDEAYYVRKERNKYRGSRSWKDQSKARKSWGRHKHPQHRRKRDWPTELNIETLMHKMGITTFQPEPPEVI